jgi:hypothetical protein
MLANLSPKISDSFTLLFIAHFLKGFLMLFLQLRRSDVLDRGHQFFYLSVDQPTRICSNLLRQLGCRIKVRSLLRIEGLLRIIISTFFFS